MSFKPDTSAVSIANMALAMVSETKGITSIDDAGFNAQAVRRWYKPVVARLLEMHHWGLGTRQSPLTSVTNDRTGEWVYAYATPTDMAFPVGFTLTSGVSSVSYYTGLNGLIGMAYGTPIFRYQHGVIYTNISGSLQYVSYDITELDFNSTFTDIVVLMLASRLALELPKDADMSATLAKNAQAAINLAMTQNLNAGMPKYGQNSSESELVRGTMFGRNWDYFASGFPAL